MSRPVFMRFGKYKGENILDVPKDYLEWMCTKPEMIQAEDAEKELYRRNSGSPDPRSIAESNGAVVPPSIEIAAIDSASMLLQDLWREHEKGVASWLLDFWQDALENGEVVSMGVGQDTTILYQNIIFFYNTFNVGFTLTDIKPTQDYYL